MKDMSYLDCHTGAASAASISAQCRQENRDMRWLCAMLLGAGVEWAGWQLMPGAQVGPSRSGEAGKLGPVQTTSWQQTSQSSRGS